MATGTYNSLEFCPKCGVKSIVRDNYCVENGEKPNRAEYICLSCGLGFKIVASRRHEHAENLFKHHRTLREK